MDCEKITEMLRLHKLWLRGDPEGVRAVFFCKEFIECDIRGADLTKSVFYGCNFYKSNLSGSNFSYSDLGYNNFSKTDFSESDLSNSSIRCNDFSKSNLSRSDIYGTDFSKNDLRGSNLNCSDLSHSNFSSNNLAGASTEGVKFNHLTAFFPKQCPEKGSYIGFKKANKAIIELLIPEDALRSSATSRKCRASKVKVLSITAPDGLTLNEVASDWDKNFIYRVGETIEITDFNKDRWNECSAGIHHFITRKEAEMYE